MKTTTLEILTPKEKMFAGEIESLIVDTVTGSAGYLPGHIWCHNLLKDKGTAQFREPGAADFRVLNIRGGFVEIRDIFTVYTEDAEWISGSPEE